MQNGPAVRRGKMPDPTQQSTKRQQPAGVIRNRGRAQSGDSASDAQPPGNEVAKRTNLLRCMSLELAPLGHANRL